MIIEFTSYMNHFKIRFFNYNFYYYFILYIFPYFIQIAKLLFNLNKDKFPGILILNKDFSKRIRAKEHWNQYLKSIQKTNTAKKYHYHGLKNSLGIINALLLRDRMTSNFSIENRYPFLDKRLVEFCFAIPTEMKFKHGWSRYILRIAMDGILPKENQWRLKKLI